MEPVREPRCAVYIEIPAYRVGAVFLQRVERIHGVPLRFAHLLPILVLHVPEHQDVFVRGTVKNERRDSEQRIKPSSRLVDRLGDKLGRKLLLEEFLVLERIVVLRKRHGARIEPTVYHLRHAFH